MIGRLGRGLVFAGFLASAGAAPVVAQGALSGEVVAADVAGYVVIACYADVDVGCDEARSGFAEIAGQGPSAPWRIDGLEAGPFLLIAWRDANGDGELQDDEIALLLDAAGEPTLVLAPAEDATIRGPGAAAAPAPGAAPAPAPGAALHPDLVGVWQQTRASAGDYRDLSSGSTFSMASGFSTMLKLRADGTFLFQFYSSGVASDCAFVSQLHTTVGHAAMEGGALALRPTERSVEVGRCAQSGTYEPGLAPIVMPAQLTKSFDFEGHRMWTLALEGGPVPLELTLLHRPPSPNPPYPAQPDVFVVGPDPPYSDIQGVWSPYPDSDLGFFEPTTNAFYLPACNGARHLWLRFSGDGYDLARAWSDYGYGGVCEKDYVYYERGRALLANLEDIGWGSSEAFRGHGRFAAEDARLVVQIRDCGADSGATVYTLTPRSATTSGATRRCRPAPT